MASMQAFFRDDENAHKYVASPRNQRIEGYWSQYRRNRSSWWINLFKDLVEAGDLNTGDSLVSWGGNVFVGIFIVTKKSLHGSHDLVLRTQISD